MELLHNYIKTESFDLLIESSGFNAYIDIIKNNIRPGGEVVLFAMNEDIKIPVNLIVCNMIKIHGNLGGAGSFKEAIHLLCNIKNEVSLMINNIIDFGQLPNVLNNNMKLLQTGIKTIIRM